MNKFGVAWFTNARNPSAGWICSPDHPAKSIDNIYELPSDTVWITNISHNTVRECSLYTIPNIREESYFRIKLTHIAEDLGLTNLPADQICETVCDVLAKAVEALNQILKAPCEFPPYRFHNHIRPIATPTHLAMSPLLPTLDPQMSEFAFKNATQINQGMSGIRFQRGTKSIRFRVSRYQHYSWIIANTLFPSSSQWTHHNIPKSVSALSPDHPSNLDWWKKLSTTHAGIAQVVITKVNPAVATFGTPGVNGAKQPPQRQWFCLPELIAMGDYCDFHVEKLFISEGDRGISDFILNACIDLPQICGGGYIAGLCLHLIGASLSSGLSDEGSPLGMYLAAVDRSLLIKLAAGIRNSNHIVGGFSAGAMTVFCRNPAQDASDLATAYTVGHSSGMLPPLMWFDGIRKNRFFQQNVDVNHSPLNALPTSYIEALQSAAEFSSINDGLQQPEFSLSSVRSSSL